MTVAIATATMSTTVRPGGESSTTEVLLYMIVLYYSLKFIDPFFFVYCPVIQSALCEE